MRPDRVFLSTLLISMAFTANARAGIVLDGSLGRGGPLTGPNYAITADLGTQQGGNLFHSFAQFNLVKNDVATFSGPASVTNIISRVTGGSPSSIDGTLRSTIPGANLYFINPGGVMFGPNARLDLTGSFHVGTADYLKLGTDGKFDARIPEQSLLTSAPPSAFGFATALPAQISIDSSQLAVISGQSISLIAGPIGIRNSDPGGVVLMTPGGNIRLISVASPGEARFGNQLDTSSFAEMGDISITNHNNLINGYVIPDIYVSSVDGYPGTISLRGNNLFMDGGAIYSEGLMIKAAENHGRIELSMVDEIRLTNWARIVSHTENNLSGAGGDIFFSAGRLFMDNDALVLADTIGSANSGNIEITATNSVGISSGGSVSASASAGSGDAGVVTVETARLKLDGASSISGNSYSSGKGGSLIIKAADSVNLSRESYVSVATNGVGDGGTATFETQRLSVDSGSSIFGSTYASGKGGNLSIKASDSVILTNDGSVSVFVGGTGDGGVVTIDTPRLIVDGGKINGTTFSAGKGSTLNIHATDSISLTHEGSIAVSVSDEGTGNGGIAILETATLSLDGGRIYGYTLSSGEGGYITLTADRLIMENDASILSASYGEGRAGDIRINTASLLKMDNSSIATETFKADGGSISIDPSLLDLHDSWIRTSVYGGAGNGGNVEIKAHNLVLDSSSIIANAEEGNGGNITLTTDSLIKSGSGSLISASSRLGLQGTILISSPIVDIGASLAEMPESILDITALSPKRCAATDEQVSSFTVLESAPGPACPDRPLVTH